MNFSSELAADLKKLLNMDPALALQLQQAESLDQVVERIQGAADRHGVVLNAENLADQLREMSAKATAGELSDEELEGVDGGGLTSDLPWVFKYIAATFFGIHLKT